MSSCRRRFPPVPAAPAVLPVPSLLSVPLVRLALAVRLVRAVPLVRLIRRRCRCPLDLAALAGLAGLPDLVPLVAPAGLPDPPIRPLLLAPETLAVLAVPLDLAALARRENHRQAYRLGSVPYLGHRPWEMLLSDCRQ